MRCPKKITYVEEETRPRGAAGYNIIFYFNKKVTGDIRDKLLVPFLRHVIQQAIISDKEHGPDIGYSEFKIRRAKCRVDVKFMKHSGLHRIPAGYEQDRYEEMEGFRVD